MTAPFPRTLAARTSFSYFRSGKKGGLGLEGGPERVGLPYPVEGLPDAVEYFLRRSSPQWKSIAYNRKPRITGAVWQGQAAAAAEGSARHR
jgi:hypothetical protein